FYFLRPTIFEILVFPMEFYFTWCSPWKMMCCAAVIFPVVATLPRLIPFFFRTSSPVSPVSLTALTVRFYYLA
ncbi:hypothetical protein VIGAN_02175800, partial [Vigna angularis var. angularis]